MIIIDEPVETTFLIVLNGTARRELLNKVLQVGYVMKKTTGRDRAANSKPQMTSRTLRSVRHARTREDSIPQMTSLKFQARFTAKRDGFSSGTEC